MWTEREPAQPFPHSPALTGLLLGAAPVLFWALVFALKVSLWGVGSTVGVISSSWGSETGFREQGPLGQPWKRSRGTRQGDSGRERHAEQWEQHGQRLGTVKGVACGALGAGRSQRGMEGRAWPRCRRSCTPC